MSFLFKNRTADPQKLLGYGFLKESGAYVYTKPLAGGELEAKITVCGGEVSAKVFDVSLGDEYTLHLVDGASGEFVGAVRAEYEGLLRDVAEKCFNSDVFKNQSKEIALYAEKTYGSRLEFLWADLPDAAVLRRADNAKWYAVFMKIHPRKLGLEGEDPLDIMDVRYPAELLEKILNGANFLRAYHMNKKHWLTAVLDGAVPTADLLRLLDQSYALAAKR